MVYYKKMKKFRCVIIIASLFFLVPCSLFARRSFTGYDEGNYKISLRLPFNLPVAYYRQGELDEGKNNHWAVWDEIGYKNHLEYALEVGYDYFINSSISLGGLVGYHFAYTRSGDLLSRVPFLFRFGYYPLQGQFEVPIILGVGGAYMNLKGYSTASIYLSIETGFSWFWSDNWGIGVRTGMHFIPEFKAGRKEDTNVTFFVPIALEINFRR